MCYVFGFIIFSPKRCFLSFVSSFRSNGNAVIGVLWVMCNVLWLTKQKWTHESRVSVSLKIGASWRTSSVLMILSYPYCHSWNHHPLAAGYAFPFYIRGYKTHIDKLSQMWRGRKKIQTLPGDHHFLDPISATKNEVWHIVVGTLPVLPMPFVPNLLVVAYARSRAFFGWIWRSDGFCGVNHAPICIEIQVY